MIGVQKKTLNSAIELLNALGCSYAIVDSSGQKYGNLEINQKKERTRAPSEFPHGEKREYVNRYLKDLPVGGCTLIPWGKYGKGLQGSVLSWFCKTHGNGSGTTMLNHSKEHIEVLRVK